MAVPRRLRETPVASAVVDNPVVGLGVTILLVTTVMAAVVREPFRVVVVQSTLPAVVGFGLVGYGWWTREQVRRPPSSVVVKWILVGLVAFFVVGFWFGTVSRAFETSFAFAVFDSLAAGAAFGCAIGVYASRLRTANETLAQRTRELQEEREKYTTLVEQSHDGIVIVQDGTIQFANPPMETLTGVDQDDLLGRDYDALVAPEDRDLVRERYERRVNGESPPRRYDVTLLGPGGERRHVDLHVSRIQYEGEPATLATFTDVTERKERERRLRRYERLVEHLPVGIYRNTPGADGEFRLLNRAMVDIFDADSKDELKAHAVSDLYLDDDERKAFSERLRRDGVVTDEELRLRTLSGDTIWGSVTAIAVEEDGDTVFDGAIQDVTERKEYERRLRDQRDDLDVLNQVVRHDIRNDLQLVLAHAGVLEDRADEALQDHVETVCESAEHAVELTTTAREMAEVMLTEDADRQDVRLRPPLLEQVEDVRSSHDDAVITVDGEVPDVWVSADEMLDSVFRNLLKNAIQHNDKAVPEVTVTGSLTDEGTVRVSVADNGPGVPDDRKKDIFGKGEKGLDSEGTGLGLYLVDTLVDGYGGDVWVEDRADRQAADGETRPDDATGAVFVVELPVAE